MKLFESCLREWSSASHSASSTRLSFTLGDLEDRVYPKARMGKKAQTNCSIYVLACIHLNAPAWRIQ